MDFTSSGSIINTKAMTNQAHYSYRFLVIELFPTSEEHLEVLRTQTEAE